jgi:hypothetical protein
MPPMFGGCDVTHIHILPDICNIYRLWTLTSVRVLYVSEFDQLTTKHHNPPTTHTHTHTHTHTRLSNFELCDEKRYSSVNKVLIMVTVWEHIQAWKCEVKQSEPLTTCLLLVFKS